MKKDETQSGLFEAMKLLGLAAAKLLGLVVLFLFRLFAHILAKLAELLEKKLKK